MQADKYLVAQEEMLRQKESAAQVAAYFSAQNKRPGAYVETYGCQQNEKDSQYLRGMLAQMGYESLERPDGADLILLNTCAIRDNAEQRVFGRLGLLSHHKKGRAGCLIGLCGCMMQQGHTVQEIKERYRYVDLVFGPHTHHRLPENLHKLLQSGGRVFDVADCDGVIAEALPVQRDNKSQALVSVMYGCDNYCSYCVVPFVRGRERSRDPALILEEVQALVEDGARDITLLGQNVNSYGRDGAMGLDFSGLLTKISALPGDFRLRFMTSHPRDAGERLFEAMAASNKVVRHLHLPVQAGSSSVLERMNRKYSAEHYLKLIEQARRIMPDISFTSDIMVGFPQESEAEFQETLDLVEAVRFDTLFTFLFSPRPGTPAHRMEGQVPHDIKQARFERLLELQNRISREINEACVGKTLRVLCEGASKKDAGKLSGRSDRNKVINFEGSPCDIDRFVPVLVTEAKTWSLEGEIDRTKTFLGGTNDERD